MKNTTKTSKKILLSLLLVAMIVVLSVSLAACNREKTPERIVLEGYRDVFFQGDEFETGVDFAVYAIYDDGSRAQITQGYTVKKESGMDMGTPGDYVITVEYEGLKATYTISVNEPTNEIAKLTVDTTNAKTKFMLGDVFSFDGVRVTVLYNTSAGKTLEVTYGDLKKFSVTVTDPDGDVEDSAFEEFGRHTVTISAGETSVSYTVDVEGVNLSTVQNAIYVGKYGAQFVNEGKVRIINTIVGNSVASDYVYKFGDNYTFIGQGANETASAFGSEYHLSLDQTGKLVAVTVENGKIVPSTVYVPEAMNGVQYDLWWHDATEYGMEATIANLYSIVTKGKAVDYVESVDENNRTYKFSYGYLMHRVTGVSGRAYKGQIILSGDTISLNDGRYEYSLQRQGTGDGLTGTWVGENKKGETCTLVIREDETLDYTCGNDAYEKLTYSETGGIVVFEYGEDSDDYYFVNEVEFTLNDEYTITSAKFTQKHYTDGFSAGADGVTRLEDGAQYASKIDAEMTQTVGERTAKNTFSEDDLLLEDFDLILDGEVLGAEEVIYGMAGADITIRIGNLKPSTADLTYDLLYFSDGVGKADPSIFTCNGFAVYRNDNVIHLRLSNGGEWELVISSQNVTKRIRLSVTGRAPESLTSEVYQSAFNAFTEKDTATPMVGVPVYFRAEPNQYANGVYTAAIEGDAQGATLKLTQIDGVECWQFVAEKTGVYTIRMTSEVAENVSCVLKVTVVDLPDFDQMLTGTYHASDRNGGKYTLTFVRDGGKGVSGTLTVDYTPDDGEKQAQTLKFYVSEGDVEPTLEGRDGEELGVALKINVDGELVLEDRYENLLTLER